MLELRSEQIEVLGRAWRSNLCGRLAVLYREYLPEATAPLDDEALARRISAAEQKARGHGIITERGIAQYVGLSLVNGPDFDENQRIRDYLRMPGATPDQKMQFLIDRCAELDERRLDGRAAPSTPERRGPTRDLPEEIPNVS